MVEIIVNKAFLFSPCGNRVVEIETGKHEVSERCAIVACDQLKIAERVSAAKPAAKASGAKK